MMGMGMGMMDWGASVVISLCSDVGTWCDLAAWIWMMVVFGRRADVDCSCPHGTYHLTLYA